MCICLNEYSLAFIFMRQPRTTVAEDRRKLKKAESVFDDGYLRVEHENYYVAIGGERLKLARAEFQLISILTREKDCYVPAEIVWRNLWNEPKPLNAKSLRVIICGIRRRLAPYGIRVESTMNVGYRLLSTKTAD